MENKEQEDYRVTKLKSIISAGDFDLALSYASQFKIFTKKLKFVEKANSANKNPAFYKQIGVDIQDLNKEAVNELREHFFE